MIFNNRSRLTTALRNRRQKKAAIQSRRSQKSTRLNFEHLERRNLLATFVVNSAVDDGTGAIDGLISLREALVAANTNTAFGDAAAGDADGDTIIFDGTIAELPHTILNGEYEISDDVIITGSVTIDAASASRIFNINTNELVALNNLTLTNGLADRGGAILSEAGGTTRLTNVTLNNNTATADESDAGGGGIFTGVGDLYATGLVASGNVASGTSGSGGAIFQASGNVGLYDAVLTSNVANRAGGGIEVVDGSFFAEDIVLGTSDLGNIAGPEGTAAPGNGGGLHISGIATASFTGGSVAGNSAASEGGGLWNQSNSNLYISGTEISGNIAAGDDADHGGGGVYNNGGTVLTLNGTAILNNEATGASGSGGGILSTDGLVVVRESNISNNSANRAGGGVEIINGTFTALDSTLSDNDAGIEGVAAPGNGGAFHVSGVATSRFNGGVVSGNAAASEGGGLWNQSGSVLTISNVQITINTAQGDGSDEGGGGVYNNGGTVRVLNGTAISNNVALGESGSGGGILSTGGQFSVIDSTVTANIANRAGGGVEIIDGRFVALRSELNNNIAGPADSASPGNGGALHVTGNDTQVFIQASDVSNNTAASEGGGLWNQEGSFLRVDTGSTITNNVASGDDLDNGGGGIFNNGGRVSVLNSTLEDNNADGVLGSGGGLFSTAGNILISESVITENSANRAGGGFEIVDGRLDVVNSNLIGNFAGSQTLEDASPGNGGAVHVTGNAATTTFSDSLISSNSAASEGGGLWNQSGASMFISGSTIRDNIAAGDDADNGGGGVFNNGGNVRITDSFINSNSASGVSGSGGGLFSTDGQILINDSSINDNVANRAGGGIEIIDGYTRLENTIVNRNNAGGDAANPGNGGAVHISGAESQFVAISSSFFSNEASNEGGGLWNQTDSLMSLRGDTRVVGNVSGDNGGGIYNKGRLLAQDSFFTANNAESDGGGIFTTSDGDSFLTEVGIRNNIAISFGGGLANFGNLSVVDSISSKTMPLMMAARSRRLKASPAKLVTRSLEIRPTIFREPKHARY